MSEPTLPLWKRISQKSVYRGRVHIVEHAAELPSGELTSYEVEHGDTCSVAVLIETPEHEIVLAHQFRFPLDRWIYDLPGGAKLKNESIEEAAVRECREEVGLAPKKLHKLHTFYPNPARTDWPAHLFYCNDYDEASILTNDPSENVSKVHMKVDDFKKLVDNQEIVDPGLLIAWYAAREKGFVEI